MLAVVADRIARREWPERQKAPGSRQTGRIGRDFPTSTGTDRAMHVVAVLALNGVVPFDLTIPCELFGRAASPDTRRPLYEVRVCGEAGTVRSGHFDLRCRWRLDELARAETVIVPGIEDVTTPARDEVAAALRAAADQGARIASICSGAFVLAQSGLLDGLRATTHWQAAPLLAARYPRVRVEADVLFVDEGDVLTSAGAAAGLDLCLHMLRGDHGAAVAAEAARLAVVPLERRGEQAQFIAHPPPASPANLAPLLQWLDENLHRPVNLDEMAGQAATSPRTFSRRFRQQTGTTPLQWLLTARVRRAQALLETTGLTVEQVATHAGFESASTLRERFSRIVGLSPSAYRKACGGGNVAKAASM
jgi:transcriptional regulator GlxA family with amidase domain